MMVSFVGGVHFWEKEVVCWDVRELGNCYYVVYHQAVSDLGASVAGCIIMKQFLISGTIVQLLTPFCTCTKSLDRGPLKTASSQNEHLQDVKDMLLKNISPTSKHV